MARTHPVLALARRPSFPYLQGQIYKGLAQTGAWGCFDEFNRIPVAVLSVCSTQYKTVLDAIRARKVRLKSQFYWCILVCCQVPASLLACALRMIRPPPTHNLLIAPSRPHTPCTGPLHL